MYTFSFSLLLKGLSNVLDYNTGIVTEELTITSHHTKINQSHLMKVWTQSFDSFILCLFSGPLIVENGLMTEDR